MSLTTIIVLLVIALLLIVVMGYNALVQLRNEAKNGWAQIDVQLKRRHDLIPNLVEAVKGYAEHERQTFEAVVQARQQALGAGNDIAAKARAENVLTGSLKSLFAVVENYPELKANQNFLALQEELVSTENRIAFARQFYNDAVMRLNNKIQMFPTNLLASLFHFQQKTYFEVAISSEREAPKVNFSSDA